MYCTGCGSQLADDASSCADCGKAVSVSTPGASSSVTPHPAATSLSWAYVQAFRNYANFSGRTGHSEYWRFALPQLVVTAILAAPFTLPLIGFLTGFYIGGCIIYGFYDCASGLWGLYTLLSILLVLDLLVFGLPLLSATTRRLHDTGKGALWLLLVLVPLPLVAATMALAGLFSDTAEGVESAGWLLVLAEIVVLTPVKLLFWSGVACMVAILLPGGDEGENRYGAPPP